MVWTTYNAGGLSGLSAERASLKEHSLPLDLFKQKRDEVVHEVLRAKARHPDNVITSFEETMRQLQMLAMVCNAIRSQSRWCMFGVWARGLPALLLPGIITAVLAGHSHLEEDLGGWGPEVAWAVCGLASGCAFRFLKQFAWQSSLAHEQVVDA